MPVLLRCCLALALLLPVPEAALAQAWPSKPIRILNGFPPGGSSDILARFIADRLTLALGQQVVVEPRTGANGLVAAQVFATVEPDGHTLLQVTMGMLSISPVMPGITMTFDPDKDIVPITRTAGLYNVLVVGPDLPVKTVKELIAYAKANPGKLTYGSAGNGSIQHLTPELFKAMTGVEMLHVAYRGSAPAMMDVMTGQVSLMMTNLSDVLSQIQAGKLRAIAYGSVPGSPLVPAPTIAESGVPDFRIDNWYGMAAPKGTPPAIVERLNAEMNRIISAPDAREKLNGLGLMPLGGTAEEMREVMLRDRAKWGQVIKAQGIKAE